MAGFDFLSELLRTVRQRSVQPFLGAGRNSNGLVPSVRVSRLAAQAIPTATWTALSFDSELWDTDRMFTSDAPTRITFTNPGRYALWANLTAVSNVTGIRYCRILANGASGIDATRSQAAVNGDATIYGTYVEVEVSNGADADLAPGEYVEVQVHQSSGGDLNYFATAGATRIGNL